MYTSPILLPLVAHILSSFGALERLQGFVSDNGRKFYQRPAAQDKVIRLQRTKTTIDGELTLGDENVVPFWAGKDIDFSIV